MKSSITLLLLCLLVCSCNETGGYGYEPPVAKYAATDGCGNMRLNIAYLFKGEAVELRMNQELIFRSDTATADGYTLSEAFCLPQDQNYTLALRTIRAGKLYLDTLIEAVSGQQVYHLDVSRPQPLNWRMAYRDTLPLQQRVFGSPDSCIRFVSLLTNTMYIQGK